MVHPDAQYLTLDLNDLLSHLVTSLQPAQTTTGTSCQALVPRDNLVAVAGSTFAFDGFEATLCDPGDWTFVSWYANCRNEDGDILAFMSLGVIFDEDGTPTQATGNIDVGGTEYELMPVEGNTYALYRVSQGEAGEGSRPCEVAGSSTATPSPLRVTPHLNPQTDPAPATPVPGTVNLTG